MVGIAGWLQDCPQRLSLSVKQVVVVETEAGGELLRPAKKTKNCKTSSRRKELFLIPSKII